LAVGRGDAKNAKAIEIIRELREFQPIFLPQRRGEETTDHGRRTMEGDPVKYASHFTGSTNIPHRTTNIQHQTPSGLRFAWPRQNIEWVNQLLK
jgi:hypothetical protein